MGSLLVRSTFGERGEGILVLQSGKSSSENGVQTTFDLGGKGSSSLEIPLHMGFKFHAGYAGLLRLLVIYRYRLKYMF